MGLKRFLWPLVAWSMSGCATIQHYKEPSTGPIATVTIKTLDTYHVNIGIVSYRGSEYLESKGDVVTILNSRAIGYAYTDQVTIKVPAEQPFRYSVKVGDMKFVSYKTIQGSVCQTHASFVPIAGTRYLVEHHTTEDGCATLLYRMDDAGGKTLDRGLKSLKSCLDPQLSGAALAQYFCKEGFRYE